MPRQALLLFVKNPIPGRTKTRLAASVGDAMALRMYHQLCAWTRRQAAGLTGVDPFVYYSNAITADDDWPNDRFTKRLQHPGGLGERLAAGFAEAFVAGYERVIVTGSDCPGIDTDYLEAAFAGLDAHDVVIGPALDGGYTLLGLRQPAPELFKGIAWSTDTVLTATLSQAAAAGRSVHQLAPLSDVDHIEDWHHYGWPLPT